MSEATQQQSEAQTEVEPRTTISTEFKTGNEGEFQKPDHDPHGETPAAAAHVSTTCDSCGKSGFVVDTVMEAASGMFDGVKKDVVCAECGE